MGRTNLAFLQSPVQGTGGNKCAPVTFDPDGGLTPVNITLSTTQTGGHIFYNWNAIPTHNGDNATGTTNRIGSNSGSIHRNDAGLLKAICYQSGYLDSDRTQALFEAPESGGQ